MSKKPTIASLQARIAELEAIIAAHVSGQVNVAITDAGNTRYNVAGVKKDGLNYTPNAVDAIRVYAWAQMAKGVDRKVIAASLISQGFTPATVRARVKRIFDGTDESCYSEAIRARLGLDEVEEESDDEE